MFCPFIFPLLKNLFLSKKSVEKLFGGKTFKINDKQNYTNRMESKSKDVLEEEVKYNEWYYLT